MLVTRLSLEHLRREVLDMGQERSINNRHGRHHADRRLNHFFWNAKAGANGSGGGVEAASVGVNAGVDIKGGRTTVLNENALPGFDFLVDE